MPTVLKIAAVATNIQVNQLRKLQQPTLYKHLIGLHLCINCNCMHFDHDYLYPRPLN